MNRTYKDQGAPNDEPPPVSEPARTEARLRTILQANSLFSALAGGIGLVVGSPIARLLGVDQAWLVRAVGAGLVAFALAVLVTSISKTDVLRTWTPIISINDLGWVAGTTAVIALGWLSQDGAVVVGVAGLAVLTFGLTQLRTLAQLAGNDPHA